MRAILTHTATFQVAGYVRSLNGNITGALKLVHNYDTYSSYQLSSAGACFSLGFTDKNYHIVTRTDAIDRGVNDIQFNASKSNAVYSSDNIQLPSVQILIIIKV